MKNIDKRSFLVILIVSVAKGDSGDQGLAVCHEVGLSTGVPPLCPTIPRKDRTFLVQLKMLQNLTALVQKKRSDSSTAIQEERINFYGKFKFRSSNQSLLYHDAR